MEIAPAHNPAALSFMDDMSAMSDRDYNQTDPSSDSPSSEEDAIESTYSSSSDEARFTRRGKVPSSVQAILRGRVARLLSEEEGAPSDALSAASTNGTNTPERFDSSFPFNSPIRAVPKKKVAPADLALIYVARDVAEGQEDAPSPEMQQLRL